MAKQQRTQTAPTAAPTQEQPSEELALDQTSPEEGVDNANEPGDDSVGAGTPAGDSEGTDALEEGEATGEGESDAGAPVDEVGEGADAHPELDTDPEAEQLAAALAAAVAAPQPTLQVNDAPEVVEPVAPVAPVGSDIPDAAPVAAPTDRAPSVSVLKPVPVKVDVKAQQAEIKFQLIVDRLTAYGAAMAPNAAVGEAEGKAQQLALWRVIEQVLKLEGAEFIKGFSLLLDFIAEHRTAHFSEKYAYRFFGPMALSAGDKRNFNRLLNLFIATADRATRRMGLEQVGLHASLAGIRDTGIQQRVAEFYQI
jgi:hypothetical protein